MERLPVVAIVPVRSPGEGKTRLSHGLSADERARLSGAMLADVTATLAASAVDRIVVAASGPAAAAAAAALGLEVVMDPPTAHALDAAVNAAVTWVGTEHTSLVVTADLPRLTPRDVGTLLAQDADVVVAPTRDGGTGGLVRRPAMAIPTAYGSRSAARHLRLAEDAGHRAVTVDLPGFRDDVDTWEDLVALTHGAVGPCTAAFLRAIGPALESTG